jgi:uncharacterized protein (TIGR02246 family)
MRNDEQAIRDFLASWFEATAKGDVARLLSLMTGDVQFLTPGKPPFGRDAFEAAFRASGQQHRTTCEGEFEEVIVVGEVAYARARLSVIMTTLTGSSTSRFAGYTLSVFRKQPDGRWLLARDANLLVQGPAGAA